MVRSGTPDAAGDQQQQSLGELVSLALKDLSQLLRYEIALAKNEFKVDKNRIVLATALIGGGLVIAFPGIVLLCFAYAYFLHWAGAWGGLAGAFGFAGLTFVVLAFIACLLALRRVRKITGMRLTRKTVIDDIGMLRRGGSADSGSGRGSVAAGAPTAEIPARRLPRAMR